MIMFSSKLTHKTREMKTLNKKILILIEINFINMTYKGFYKDSSGKVAINIENDFKELTLSIDGMRTTTLLDKVALVLCFVL